MIRKRRLGSRAPALLPGLLVLAAAWPALVQAHVPGSGTVPECAGPEATAANPHHYRLVNPGGGNSVFAIALPPGRPALTASAVDGCASGTDLEFEGGYGGAVLRAGHHAPSVAVTDDLGSVLAGVAFWVGSDEGLGNVIGDEPGDCIQGPFFGFGRATCPPSDNPNFSTWWVFLDCGLSAAPCPLSGHVHTADEAPPGCPGLLDRPEEAPRCVGDEHAGAVAPACADLSDNDADGRSDHGVGLLPYLPLFAPDPGCVSWLDDDERDPSAYHCWLRVTAAASTSGCAASAQEREEALLAEGGADARWAELFTESFSGDSLLVVSPTPLLCGPALVSPLPPRFDNAVSSVRALPPCRLILTDTAPPGADYVTCFSAGGPRDCPLAGTPWDNRVSSVEFVE